MTFRTPKLRDWLRILAGAGLQLAMLTQEGCHSRGGAPQDGGQMADLRRRPFDLADEPEDFATELDLRSGADLAGDRDLALSLDMTGDLGGLLDLALPPDLTMPRDLGTRPPCLAGAGWAAFRFKYDGSTSARLQAFGLPDSSNWEAVPGRPASFDDALHGGGLNIGGGNFILIRFSLVGLTTINSATLSVYGRSYSTGSSGSFEGWSPIHSPSIKSPVNSVSNAWPYRWTSVDYTANVVVGDPPGLTGIRLYAGPSSSTLIINTVELCIDGS
jgi:hypothetical protein